jgi:hypothetical protein
MFNLTLDNPYIYVDSFKDRYTFYIFHDNEGGKHLSIKVEYSDYKKTIDIFGQEVSAYSFALPLDGETILWNAYPIKLTSPHGNCMSEEARKLADKIFKLKAFL